MIQIQVRTGLGTVTRDGNWFTDFVKTINRVPRQHKGWQSVTYKGKRYQLYGGVHVLSFICLNNPIGKKVRKEVAQYFN